MMLVMLFSSLLCEVRWLLLLLIKLSVWCSNSTQILVWISLFVFIVDFIIFCGFLYLSIWYIQYIVYSILWISLFIFFVEFVIWFFCGFFICLYCDFCICLFVNVFICLFCGFLNFFVISLFVFFVDFFICLNQR